MEDFISKVVIMVLIFMLLVLAPIQLSYVITDGTNKRLLLNETETFIDEMASKGEITEQDIDSFYMRVNSYGMAIDVKVDRLIRTSVEAPNGEIKTMYTPADASLDNVDGDNVVYTLNKGDLVRVKVKEIVTSASNKMTYMILRINNKNLDFSLVKVVN